MAEHTMERRNTMRFALPAIGAAIPLAAMLIRKARHRVECMSEEEWLLRQSKIDLMTAMNTALRYMPGTPVEVELEEEHGMVVWSVEIVPRKGGPTREVLIDAETGDVLEMLADFEDLETRAA